MSNLSRWVRFHSAREPGRTALIYGDTHVSYAMLWDRVGRLSASLRAWGVRCGDRVAVLMKNSSAYVEVALAVSHVGGVLVPINFRLSRDEVHYILQDSGSVCFFCDEELAIEPPALAATIIVDSSAQSDTSLLCDDGRDDIPAPVRSSDLLRIMHTSGTTDRPKGVMHSYANFYAKTSDHLAVLGLTSETRLLIAGPLYHVGAFDLPGIGVAARR